MKTIQEYHSKPTLIPLYERKTFSGLYFGVELEYESKGSPENLEMLARKTQEYFGDFVTIKQDNSLFNGFEICTRPATLELHKKTWQGFFKTAPDDFQTFYNVEELTCGSGWAIGDGEWYTETKKLEQCGMHVHLNRESMSDLQVGKIVSFIHRKDNREFIEYIAGRPSNEFCNYEVPRSFKHALLKYNREFDRKVGVNLHNENTIEIRIFKSTTDADVFFKNLEFCEALVLFTTPSHNSLRDSINVKKFIEFVETNKTNYPYLTKFLEERE
jgi:hypothetical protein